jgi:glycosyltransferase involved in cell wall biosynthesis
MDKIGVMHLIDTLNFGGAERVAVNLANLMPRQKYQTHLCTTRRDGPLERYIAFDVGRLRLKRKRRFEVVALRNLIRYMRLHNIKILHAHGNSVFNAVLVSLFLPGLCVVWHDHCGAHGEKQKNWFLYWSVIKRVKAIIAVTQSLKTWYIETLKIPSVKVHYIPNFVVFANNDSDQQPELPQCLGKRLVYVANLHHPKNHLMLIKAMASVVSQEPKTQLILVGGNPDSGYEKMLLSAIRKFNLENSVIYFGERTDIGGILKQCDIGILCSLSEGFPLVLLEYAAAGLAVIATRVGQCEEILENGESGVLVPPGDSEALAKAILTILKEPANQHILGKRLSQYVNKAYNPEEIIEKISSIYIKSLGKPIPEA